MYQDSVRESERERKTRLKERSRLYIGKKKVENEEETSKIEYIVASRAEVGNQLKKTFKIVNPFLISDRM